MNDLRKELERQFRERGLIDSAADEAQKTEETQKAEGPVVQTEQTVIETFSVPKGYSEKFASDFKNLPKEWQEFLSSHERDIEKKLEQNAMRMQVLAVLEQEFLANQERLQAYGIQQLEQWLQTLIAVDKAIERDPVGTLQGLAAVYNVNLNKASLDEQVGAVKNLSARMGRLEQYYKDLTSVLHNYEAQRLIDILRMFGQQTDEAGRLVHPYFSEVKDIVMRLLQSGAFADVNQAYESALWMHPTIRADLINKQISAKAAEAQKAKKAAFSPKGKAEAPKRALTLREELEKNMAALKD